MQIRGLDSEIIRLKGKILELDNEVERLKKELNRTRRQLEVLSFPPVCCRISSSTHVFCNFIFSNGLVLNYRM